MSIFFFLYYSSVYVLSLIICRFPIVMRGWAEKLHLHPLHPCPNQALQWLFHAVVKTPFCGNFASSMHENQAKPSHCLSFPFDFYNRWITTLLLFVSWLILFDYSVLSIEDCTIQRNVLFLQISVNNNSSNSAFRCYSISSAFLVKIILLLSKIKVNITIWRKISRLFFAWKLFGFWILKSK